MKKLMKEITKGTKEYYTKNVLNRFLAILIYAGILSIAGGIGVAVCETVRTGLKLTIVGIMISGIGYNLLVMRTNKGE